MGKRPSMNLSNPQLLRHQAYINGAWIPAKEGRTFPVLNPFNDAGLEKVRKLVEDAKRKGATIEIGGRQLEAGERCYAPTVLSGITKDMDLLQTEIFGPVAPVVRFDTEAEVISLANDTPYGLAAYFYGRDYALIWRVAEALDYGMVGINTGMISTAVAPFGGVKESGFGREGSKYGLGDYLEVKYMCWGGIQ